MYVIKFKYLNFGGELRVPEGFASPMTSVGNSSPRKLQPLLQNLLISYMHYNN